MKNKDLVWAKSFFNIILDTHQDQEHKNNDFYNDQLSLIIPKWDTGIISTWGIKP